MDDLAAGTRCAALGLANLALTGSIVLIEVLIPNAGRFTEGNPATGPIDFLPPRLTLGTFEAQDALQVLLSYPAFLLGAALLGGLLLLSARVAVARLARERAALRDVEGELRLATADRKIDLSVRKEVALGREARYAGLIVFTLEPLLGALLLTNLAWLGAVVVAGKLDVQWVRPFLAPPMLVAQNVQQFGGLLFRSLGRSALHLGMGMLAGTSIGILLGFGLAHLRRLARWTHWQIIALAALPPLFLVEIFKQVGALLPIPFTYGPDGSPEGAFRLAILLATWAAIWPALTATSLAVSSIDPEFRHGTRLLGARSWPAVVRYIELPAIAPAVLRNLRISFAIGLIVIILGEQSGPPAEPPSFGYAYNHLLSSDFKVQTLLAFLVFTTALIVLFELARHALERRLLRGAGSRRASVMLSEGSADQQRQALTPYEAARREAFPSPRAAPSGDAIVLENVRKTYANAPAFEQIGPKTVPSGQVLSIVGRSGAGKSTLLKLILGVEEPDSREARIAVLGRPVNGPDALGEIGDLVSYVSQRPLLLPQLDVESNILFGLRQEWARLRRRHSPASVERKRYIAWLLGGDASSEGSIRWTWVGAGGSATVAAKSPLGRLVEFFGLADKMRSFPSELSGGEAQRVHLLRWLCLGRPVLLLDEAFSALDQPLKGMVRDALVDNARFFGTTVVYVSHDRADVLQVSDRIWFVNEHVIAADETPAELFFTPKNRQLAVFLGHTNLFRLEAAEEPAGVRILEDAYRGVTFDLDAVPTVRVTIPPELGRTAGSVLAFVSRSDVNVLRFVARPESPSDDLFQVGEVRFTGTHYEVDLHRQLSGGRSLRLQCVVQTDDLEKKLEITSPIGIPEALRGRSCTVELLRMLPLPS